MFKNGIRPVSESCPLCDCQLIRGVDVGRSSKRECELSAFLDHWGDPANLTGREMGRSFPLGTTSARPRMGEPHNVTRWRGTGPEGRSVRCGRFNATEDRQNPSMDPESRQPFLDQRPGQADHRLYWTRGERTRGNVDGIPIQCESRESPSEHVHPYPLPGTVQHVQWGTAQLSVPPCSAHTLETGSKYITKPQHHN
jgi:hypothetical protein